MEKQKHEVHKTLLIKTAGPQTNSSHRGSFLCQILMILGVTRTFVQITGITNIRLARSPGVAVEHLNTTFK